MEKSKTTKKSEKVAAAHAGHSSAVVRAGAIAIGVNLLLAVFKLVLSLVSGSLAVLTDALHGLVDTLSGLIVIVSEKVKPHLKRKHKDGTTTPLSHTEVEQLGARVIGVIILVVAVHIAIESIEGIFAPEELQLSVVSIMILIVSIAAKLALSYYLRREAVATHSDTLHASSIETLNDCFISGAVLISTLVFVLFHINLEGVISLLVALLIAKSGVELLIGEQHHKPQN